MTRESCPAVKASQSLYLLWAFAITVEIERTIFSAAS